MVDREHLFYTSYDVSLKPSKESSVVRQISMPRLWGILASLILCLLVTQERANADSCRNTWSAPIRTYWCQDGYICETMDCLYCDVCDTNCSCDSMILCWCDDRAVFLRSCWEKGCDTGVPLWKPGPMLSASPSPSCLPGLGGVSGVGGSK